MSSAHLTLFNLLVLFSNSLYCAGTLIKPSFCQPGLKHSTRENTTAEEIAAATAAALVRSVPVGVAGVAFLSGTQFLVPAKSITATENPLLPGGLSDEMAASYLASINALVNASSGTPNAYGRLPPLTFSFGRGLQGSAMAAWVNGDAKGAQDAFIKRAKECSDAAKGAGVKLTAQVPFAA